MAVTLSDIFTDQLADPPVLHNYQTTGRSTGTTIVSVAITAAISADDLFPLFRIRSDAVMLNIWRFAGATSTALTFDVGLYSKELWTASSTGTALDADVYCDATNLASLASDLTNAECYGDGGQANDSTNMMQQVWQDAGLSAAPTPGTEYDVVGKCVGTVTAPSAQNLRFRFDYLL